jgi:type III secretory pathway component EscU
MHFRKTFSDTMKENKDKKNLIASLSKMISGFVSVICVAFFQVHTKLYFFTCRSQLDITERKTSFVFGSALSFSLCVLLFMFIIQLSMLTFLCFLIHVLWNDE